MINNNNKNILSESSKNSYILYNIYNNNFGNIILNNPKVYNALNSEMEEAMINIVSAYVNEKNLNFNKFIPIKYSPNKYSSIPKIIYLNSNSNQFCSGGNIVDIYHAIKNNNIDLIKLRYKRILTLIHLLYFMNPILIVEWKGYVMGGGVGISINSPIRICTETTIFSMPECLIGHFPDVGAAYFFRQFFKKNIEIGLYCALTGYRIKGKECLLTGIATNYIINENLEKVKINLINLCKENENVNLKIIQNELKKFGEIYDENKKYNFPNEDIIIKVFKPDSIYGIFERLENIKNNGNEFEKNFAIQTLNILNNASPISILIFTEMYKTSNELNNIFETYIREEKCFPISAVKGDFKEGIRANLIDKDKKFNFKYKSIYDIKNPNEIIKEFLLSN